MSAREDKFGAPKPVLSCDRRVIVISRYSSRRLRVQLNLRIILRLINLYFIYTVLRDECIERDETR